MQPAVDPEKIREHIHNMLFENVDKAVDTIMHLEKAWSKNELVKRIVRYINRSALNEELPKLEWREVAEELISGSMQAYTAACGDKEWFYELDLAPSFAAAAWELIERKPRWKDLQTKIVEVFEGKIDDVLTTRALWDVTKATFADTATQAKVERALSRTYQPSLDECLMDLRPLQAIDRVEAFTKKWVDGSMQRAWSSLESPEETLTQKRVLRLFSSLVAPFGDESPSSCLPRLLIQDVGRPPRNWPFLKATIESLFRDWGLPHARAGAPAPKRRRSGSALPADGVDEDGVPPDLSSDNFRKRRRAGVLPELAIKAEQAEDHEEFNDEATNASEEELRSIATAENEEEEGEEEEELVHEGIPECTSAEDCIGSSNEVMIQHLIDSGQGDVYCEACWRTFVVTNSALEGVYRDTQEVWVP